MATLVAFAQFDLSEQDFNYYIRSNPLFTFEDNINASFNGVIYQDHVLIQSTDNFVLEFFGADFVRGLTGITAGTVAAISETDKSSNTLLWYVQGISVSAAAVSDAAQTASNSDELALIAAAFAGDDTITLSSSGDRMNGFAGDDHISGLAGNDEIDGGSGNDILNGGSGTDIAVYASPFASVTVTFEGDVCIVAAPGEGTDRLTGFEFVRFGDEVRSVSSLADLAPPTIVAFSPGDGATGVSASTDISLTFSEQIQRGDSAIYLRVGSPEGSIVEQFDTASSTRLTISDTKLTIDPTADLAGGTSYFVTVDGGSVKDLAGNDVAPLASYEFTTAIGVPPAADWRLFASDGFVATVGGSGQVFGTQSFQDIRVEDVAGAIGFDASFNRGGDVIRFSGSASDWNVIRSGSSAVFSDGDSFVTIPVGPVGTSIVFDDGARTLKYDPAQAAITIGAQSFGFTIVEVTASPEAGPLPGGADEQALGRLFVSSGATVSAAGQLGIFGTNDTELVRFTAGSAQFDASFNRGCDTLLLDLPAEEFTAIRQGSSVLLQSEDIEILLPVGKNGMTLTFAGGDERDLLIDTAVGAIAIGDQLITTTMTSLVSIG